MIFSLTKATWASAFARCDFMDFARRRNSFRAVTKTKKNIQTVLVTTYGIVKNKYAGIVNAVVTADDLFV